MHPLNLQFVQHVKAECRRFNVKCMFSPDRKVSVDGSNYGGYFDTKELLVTNGSERWVISTLVHEFSHMEQWIYDAPIFSGTLRGGHDSIQVMDDWIHGKEYAPSTITHAVSLVRDCELDCERRALINIDKYKLHLNVEHYCQEANAYVLSFNYVKKYRKQDFETSQLDDRIVRLMPKDLDSMDYTTLSKTHEKIFKRYLH